MRDGTYREGNLGFDQKQDQQAQIADDEWSRTTWKLMIILSAACLLKDSIRSFTWSSAVMNKR